MRLKVTVTEAYSFDELSEEAQENALETFAHVNVDHDWWDSVYLDAEQVGLVITSFDACRWANKIAGYLTVGVHESVQAILENHGPECGTYRLAQEYYRRKHQKHTNPFTAVQWLYDLREEYLTLLRQEYEYLTSREQVQEFIELNQIEFNQEGRPV